MRGFIIEWTLVCVACVALGARAGLANTITYTMVDLAVSSSDTTSVAFDVGPRTSPDVRPNVVGAAPEEVVDPQHAVLWRNADPSRVVDLDAGNPHDSAAFGVNQAQSGALTIVGMRSAGPAFESSTDEGPTGGPSALAPTVWATDKDGVVLQRTDLYTGLNANGTQSGYTGLSTLLPPGTGLLNTFSNGFAAKVSSSGVIAGTLLSNLSLIKNEAFIPSEEVTPYTPYTSLLGASTNGLGSIGFVQPRTQGFVFDAAGMPHLVDGSGAATYVVAANDSEVVGGISLSLDLEDVGQRVAAAIWNTQGDLVRMFTLGDALTTMALAVNARGDIVGQTASYGSTQAFFAPLGVSCEAVMLAGSGVYTNTAALGITDDGRLITGFASRLNEVEDPVAGFWTLGSDGTWSGFQLLPEPDGAIDAFAARPNASYDIPGAVAMPSTATAAPAALWETPEPGSLALAVASLATLLGLRAARGRKS